MKPDFEFPIWLYHREHEGQIVYDLKQYEELGHGWDRHHVIYGEKPEVSDSIPMLEIKKKASKPKSTQSEK